MITTRRLLLTSSTPRILSSLEKFEGIQVAKDASEIGTIWGLNKTPLIETELIKQIGNDNIVSVPNFGEENFIPNFTKWAYSQGFEPGEYCTGQIYDTSMEPCILCSIINHKGMTQDTTIYNAHVQNEVDCILYESENFIVTSELGSLRPGFLMIVPKAHDFLSIAQLSSNLFGEYFEVCKDIETILKATFGLHLPVSFFEHGSSPAGLSSHKKSIVHAHVHVLIGFELQKKYLEMVRMQPVKEITVAKDCHYFSYQLGTEGTLLCCYDERVFVQRQFARQVLALELGYAPTQYNWRYHKFSENTHTTLYKLHLALESNVFCERITQRTLAFKNGYQMRENTLI